MREALEKLLASGREDALLRFSLGNACMKDDDPKAAAVHFRRAVELDPEYSAAWKMLGKSLQAGGDPTGAARAWEQGITAAGLRGDIQAGREMTVFLTRARRAAQGEGR